MHPKNKNNGLYDFDALAKAYVGIETFVEEKHGRKTIDFSNPDAVKALNKALLFHHHGIKFWDFPSQYLCPPVPGREDYIRHLADVLKNEKNDEIAVLDIGTGANCIFPLIGNSLYGWHFLGTEVDFDAYKSAKNIVAKNQLSDQIQFRFQKNKSNILREIIEEDDYFDISICNPPFHESEADALKASNRKWKNLGIKQKSGKDRNFGGKNSELWYPGGEKAFIKKYVYESQNYKNNVKWFSVLVSKKTNLPSIQQYLKTVKVEKIKIIEMAQGQKQSRIVLWSFD